MRGFLVLRRRLANAKTGFLNRSGAVRLSRRVRPPRYPGLRSTWKRFLNYQIVRYQQSRGDTVLRGYPLSLTFEATNVCNLRCPYCFTGAGEAGRTRSMMPLDLYRRLLDELGDYALVLDFYNWGEPMLNKNIYEMIRLGVDRGLSTVISTNFSLPFDSERAEKLVASGLAAIGLSIDGSNQESLEQYRVGASYEKIMQNIKLLVEAKQKLRSETPVITWAFHVFDYNRDEVAQARQIAEELGLRFTATKGWVAGEEWDRDSEYQFPIGTGPTSSRCKYLWSYAVVNNDGRVAPCAATFYESDDFGSVADSTFKDVWNNERFQEARRLFRTREGASEFAKGLICHDCPYTLVWEDYKGHCAKRLPKKAFEPRLTTNDWFNYFFQKRRLVNGKPNVQPSGDVIGLEPVSAPQRD